ncbi:MAG: DUF882 domain-containing protein [Rhizobiaceae bacterium]|nr:DUF882 domain-containing protein [Rhizobiaceae bacterium]MCV0406921.1 DUF882 domain-containing protein [Rhizobiaceae bacterium]
MATFVLAIVFAAIASAPARAETRSLKLYFIHTKERAEITYKRNGRYIQSGLNEINRFLRDWRRNEPTKMDPRLLDLVWETYRQVGARDYIHVVSAYRSPATNSMLRKRSSGVAQKSQHTLGKAMDFYIPGVSLTKLRNTALRLQGGGVGYYPKSGSPFVHLDVGNVRHWPRMSRSELVAVFPDGNTLHVPTDGKPLPGYNQALAAYNKRKASGGAVTVAQAERRGGFLSALFGGGADEEEEASGQVAMAWSGPDRQASPGNPRPRRQVATAPEAPAASSRDRDQPLPGVNGAQPDERPAPPAPVAEPAPPETPETIIAALPARAVPTPLFAPRPQVDVGRVDIGPIVEELPANPAAEGVLALATDPASGKAAAEALEVAANVPLPSRRPDFVSQAPVTVAGLPDTVPVNALAPAQRESAGERAIQNAITTASAVPGLRPEPASASAAGLAKAQLASLPASRPEPAKGAPPAASQRSAMLAGERPQPVRTTQKGAKPSARDAVPEPKPVVLPAQPDDARWAFHNEFVINSKRDATAPAYARNIVRAAPEAVYTAGFQQAPAVDDPTRFSGKAIAFLPVAKFQRTN